MRLLIVIAALLVLGVGLGMSYVLFRQIGTDVMTIEAAAEFTPNGQGERCATVKLAVEPRMMARWPLAVGDGESFAGAATVQGQKHMDIGLTILSPGNRLVLFDPQRKHEHEFSVTSTIRGDYIFELDNRHSTFTSKHVTISVCLA